MDWLKNIVKMHEFSLNTEYGSNSHRLYVEGMPQAAEFILQCVAMTPEIKDSEPMNEVMQFTDRSKMVLQLANQEAQRLNHECVDTHHILLGLCKEGQGIAAHVLKNMEVDLRKIREMTEKIIPFSSEVSTPGKLPHTPDAKRVTEQAIAEARNLGHKHIGTEHILLGLIHQENSTARLVLKLLNVKAEKVREEILALLLPANEGGSFVTSDPIDNMMKTFAFVDSVGGFASARQAIDYAEKVMRFAREIPTI